MHPAWTIVKRPSPVIAVAVHDGHDLRPHVQRYMALSDAQRLCEEDPFTGSWTRLAPTQVVVHRSRFEFDLNRPNRGCVYETPDHAWGLHVWRRPLPRAAVATSRTLHAMFYEQMYELLHERVARWGYVLVLDLHTYNYRRHGSPAPAKENPDVNLGTGTLDRDRWAPLIERFLGALRGTPCCRRLLDVRENVRFRGGYFPRWVHTTFPAGGCALAIEVKKFFMDECTGHAQPRSVAAVAMAIKGALSAVTEPGGRTGRDIVLRPELIGRAAARPFTGERTGELTAAPRH